MIIVVFGLPGSGKTSFSRHLKKELNARHLNTDIIREEMNIKGLYDEKSKQEVYQRMITKAKEELDKGSDVILDGTFHKQARRQLVTGIAEKTGKNIFFIEIKALEESIIKRLKGKREHSEADFEVYEKIKKEFDSFESDHLILWSDSETPDKMLIKAKNYIHGYRPDTCIEK